MLNYIKSFTLFNILLLVLLYFLQNFQLIGLTDNGFYIAPLYNLMNFQSMQIAIYGELNNFLANHFTPVLFILSPLALIFKNPIMLSYAINYIFYILWLWSAFYIYKSVINSKFTLLNSIIFFTLFFSSITVLFNFFLNYNGLHMVLLATPFLTLSYYFLLIKQEHKKALLWYLPTLMIKEEFWLLLIFFNVALYLSSKEKRYILFSFISAILFYLLYFKLMKSLYTGDKAGLLAGHYSYIFESKSIGELIENIFNLPLMKQRLALLFSFFVPFLLLIDFKKITIKDILIFIFLIAPTMGYCFLSKQSPMTYWLYEHYSLPILPVMFIAIMKYPKITKFRIFSYLIINMIFILGVLSFKQPWQYKYYVDEPQLKERVFPQLDLSYSDFILSEDRTGLYFSSYQVDYIDFINFKNNINKKAKYIIFNTRYSYSSTNLKLSKPLKPITSYDYITNFKNNIQNYGILYLNYPFIVYEKDLKSDLKFDKALLDSWDKKTVETNKWF